MTMLWIGLGVKTTAKADIMINTPPGLVAGDAFRIAFVTGQATNATSTEISYYNNFVNDDAIIEAGGGVNVVTYDGTTITFAAIASTASTNAVTNIGEYGVPVYLSNGTLVTPSDTSTGLWSGTLTNELDTDLTGGTEGTDVWTGTAPSGGDANFGSALGSSEVVYGESYTTTSWIAANFANRATYYHMYGISQVLTVPAATVPEPSSICLAMLGLGAAIWYSAVLCHGKI